MSFVTERHRERGNRPPHAASPEDQPRTPRRALNSGVGSRLIRKETAVSESTTEMTGAMIDPVTRETIDQKELAERLLAQAKDA